MDKSKFPRKTMGEYGRKIRARLRHPAYRMNPDTRYVRVEEQGTFPLPLFPVTKVAQPAASVSKLPTS